MKNSKDINQKDEEIEVNVMEISLNKDEIDEWMFKLEKLKETKTPVILEIDDENELQINLDEEEK